VQRLPEPCQVQGDGQVHDEGEEVMNTKTCYKCKREQSVVFFFKHHQTSDGLHSWCKSCCKEGNEKSRAKKYSTFEGRVPTFLVSCRTNARKRQNEFSLTASDLVDMWNAQGGICCYSGLQMELQPNSLFSVSVERVDNSIGYTVENTVLVCKAVNSMKSSMTGEQFLMFCRAVAGWMQDEEGNDVRFMKNG